MDVLVIALSGSVHVGLARAAMRQGWTVLALDNAVQAMREIRDRSPRLVVVQVSLLSGEPITLIRMLRHSTQPVLIVAVANSHRNQLERIVRDAGVSCYLPAAEEEDQVIQTVASMLDYVPSHLATGTTTVPVLQLSPPPRLTRPGKRGVR